MARTTTLSLVRCLDCDTEYYLTSDGGEAGPCPHCGGVGWVAVDACSSRRPEGKTS
jgi:hypothetical protein